MDDHWGASRVHCCYGSTLSDLSHCCLSGIIPSRHQYMLQNKCISYQTIENRGDNRSELISEFQNYIFGCDICQDVCPWNKKIKPTHEDAFKPNQKFLSLSFADFENMEKAEFDQIYKKSAVMRAGYEVLKRNINFVKTT